MRDISGSSSSDKVYSWLCLRLIKGVGNSIFLKLLQAFGSPDKALEADEYDLINAGIRRDVARNIIKRDFLSDPEKEIEKIRKLNARIITFDSEEYPPLLKEIDYPPVLLYALGKKIPSDQFFIAVVGSRNASHYGIRTAGNISYRLARLGIGIVSGMAKGIDTYAHKGAIKANGYTIAVLGTGIDVIYPRENRELFQKIKESGTIITEFPTGTPPEAKNFPIRNRIISGISKGVLVVEATRRSGSLITASFAIDQGREVFAIPGMIDSIRSQGTHFLIKQGAKLVEDVEDILEEFGIRVEEPQDKKEDKALIKLNNQEKKIYECLDETPVHIDEIIRSTELDPSEVLSTLLRMELKGIVRQMPGRLFVKNIG